MSDLFPLSETKARSARRGAALPFGPVGLIAAAMLLAALWRTRTSFGQMMELDELYTATLIDTPSLGHLWAGAVKGVDGNPPLYLSIAWALTHAVQGAPERALRPFNLTLLAATAAVVYRLGRRVASPVTVAAVLALLPALGGLLSYALLEPRTYALYLFLVAATLAAALGVVDRPCLRRTAALAGIGLLATLAHSFGGFYVLATLGAAGLTCFAAGDRRGAGALGLAAAPSLAATAAWIAVSYPLQKAVATPYGWIPAPDAAMLLGALSGSQPLSVALGSGLALALAVRLVGAGGSPVRGGPVARLRLDLRRLVETRRDVVALYAALLAYAGLTAAAWVGSQVITPFFVQRYFVPDLLIAALLPLPAAEAARRGVRPAIAVGAAAACVLLGLWSASQRDVLKYMPCLDAEGRFLEAGAARGGLPVIAESPHAWLPRSRYAPDQTTLYPLDWRVVLEWPDRARNNAMDFHIMEILRDWAAPGSALAADVLTTDDILARYGRFLVLDETARGWFDALRARTPVSATLIREGAGCRLWEVARGGAGPER